VLTNSWSNVCPSTFFKNIKKAWISIINRLYNALFIKDEAIGAISRTSAERAKAEELKKESKGLATLFKSRGFVIHFVITVVLTIIFIWLLVSVSTDGEVNSFDPFAILGIDSGSDDKSIKKAFRSLSLKYHPDKNPGDRAAEAKFMMVAKAYEALTDAVARENWEKYGNPDGKQSLEVSIGLPDFLLDTGNRNLVLMVYLIIMVGVIPFCVYSYYSDSSKFGEKDVMYDTYSWYHSSLTEHTLIKWLPEVLAGSAEFRKHNVPKTAEDKQAVSQVMSLVKTQMPKPKFNHPIVVKGNVLMHSHLLRKSQDIESEQLTDDLKFMLRLSTSLIDAMISVCQHQDSLQTAMNCIEFGQYVTQGIWVKDSTLLQLPHFTEEEVKHCERGKNAKSANISEYRALPDDQKKGMADFSEEQKKDVANYLEMLPDVSIESKVFVDDDEDDKVYEGDLCTIRVTLTRNNLANGEKAGLVHAPRFPFPKKEAWWIILGTKQGKIVHIEKVGNPSRVVEHNIKFLAPAVGEYEFDLFVKSNAYLGLDQQSKVTLTTLDNSSLPEYKVHPDDAELDDEPTLFEEMLNANIEQDSDDEDESDEEDDDKKKDGASDAIAPKSEAELKKERLKKARNQDDDDDDDDDEAEEVYTDQ
jgi:translocation protein SEC63